MQWGKNSIEVIYSKRKYPFDYRVMFHLYHTIAGWLIILL